MMLLEGSAPWLLANAEHIYTVLKVAIGAAGGAGLVYRKWRRLHEAQKQLIQLQALNEQSLKKLHERVDQLMTFKPFIENLEKEMRRFRRKALTLGENIARLDERTKHTPIAGTPIERSGAVHDPVDGIVMTPMSAPREPKP